MADEPQSLREAHAEAGTGDLTQPEESVDSLAANETPAEPEAPTEVPEAPAQQAGETIDEYQARVERLGLDSWSDDDAEQALGYYSAMNDANMRGPALDRMLSPEIAALGFNSFAEFAAAAQQGRMASQGEQEEPPDPWERVQSAQAPYNPDEIFWSEDGRPLKPVEPPAFYDPGAIRDAVEARIEAAKSEWLEEQRAEMAEAQRAQELQTSIQRVVSENNLADVKFRVNGVDTTAEQQLYQAAIAYGALNTDQWGNPAPPSAAVQAAWEGINGLAGQLAKGMVSKQQSTAPKTTGTGSTTSSADIDEPLPPPKDLEEAAKRGAEFYGSKEALEMGRGR